MAKELNEYGYKDPTAFTAIHNIERKEIPMKEYKAGYIKRLKFGTPVRLVKDGQTVRAVEGWVVGSGKKKVFRASITGTVYEIEDREGWHWET